MVVRLVVEWWDGGEDRMKKVIMMEGLIMVVIRVEAVVNCYRVWYAVKVSLKPQQQRQHSNNTTTKTKNNYNTATK